MVTKTNPFSLEGIRGKIALAAGVALLGLGLWGLFPSTYAYTGSLFEPPVQVPPLGLVDVSGETVNWSDWDNDLVLVYFGYTFCPDFCPLTLANIDRALGLLGTEATGVEVVMISVDPERDTAERLEEFLSNFNPRFWGLRGEEAEIRRIAGGFGVQFIEEEPQPSGTYLIDHTTTLWGVDPTAGIRIGFPTEISPTELAADLEQLLS